MALEDSSCTAVGLSKARDEDSVSSSENERDGGEDESGESDESGVDSTSEGERQGDDDEWSEESDSSVASSESFTAEDEKIYFPVVLPTSSVKLMTQSVGCQFEDYVASALGQLAMKKLRHAMMIANQLGKHVQSRGLGVDHFSMAEKIMGTRSYGHKSNFLSPKFKHIRKGVSVMQDSIPVDLVGSVLHSRKNPIPLRRVTKVSLTDNWLDTTKLQSQLQPDSIEETENKLLEDSSPSVDGTFEISDPSPSSSSDSSYFDSEGSDSNVTECVSRSRQSKPGKRRKLRELRSKADRNLSAELSSARSSPNIDCVRSTLKLETLMEKILVLNEESEVKGQNHENIGASIPNEGFNSKPPKVTVGIEWIDYIKVFVHSFFAGSMHLKNLDQTSSKSEIETNSRNTEFKQTKRKEMSRNPKLASDDFKLLIEDINSNGVFPILSILLNFFRDYMQCKFGKYDVEGLRQILSFIKATLLCPVHIDRIYVQKICKTLMLMLALPLPSELHQEIAHVFILILKKAENESLTLALWICRYVTATLTWCLESCLHNFTKTVLLLKLALSIGNALEGSGLHVAFDLGWHNLVLEFIQGCQYLRSQLQSTGGSSEPMDHDGLHPPQTLEVTIDSLDESFRTQLSEIEPVVTDFFRLFLSNYGEKISKETMERIHQIIIEDYGEKTIPYLTHFDEPYQKRKKKVHATTNRRFRSAMWKSKKILIGKIKR